MSHLMTLWIQIPMDNPLIQTVLVILAIVVIWFVLQMIFKIAMRIFIGGCLLIVIVGVILLILRQLT